MINALNICKNMHEEKFSYDKMQLCFLNTSQASTVTTQNKVRKKNVVSY